MAAILIVLGAVRAEAQLQLDAPALPAALFDEAIDQAERQIAQIIQARDGANKSEQLVLDAQRNLRKIARGLLLAARDAQKENADGAIAGLYGLKLLDGARAFDELIDDLPVKITKAIDAEPRDTKRIATLKQAVDGLKAFNAVATDGSIKLNSTRQADIDTYLQTMLSPLAATAQALGQAPPTSTWISMQARPSTQKLNAKMLDALGERAKKIALTPESQQAITMMADLMKRGLDRPQYWPRIVQLHDQISRLLDAAVVIIQSTWLDEPTRQEIQQQIQTAVLLYQDPDTRDAARSRTERLVRMSRLVVTLNDLAKIEGVPMDHLRGLFMTAARLEGNEKTQPISAQLGDMIQQVAGAVALQRGGKEVRLPLDIQRVKQVLQRSYVKQEQALFDALDELVKEPRLVSSPAWTSRVAQLHDLGVQVYHLDHIPGWVTRMGKFNPRSARGLYKQLRQIAEDLLNAGANQGAASALAEMERQLSLFEQLPYEKELTTGDNTYAKYMDRYRGAIAQQISLLRSQWAAAWGAGADPTPTGKILLSVRRLFVAIHDAQALESRAGQLDQLNRWAGWWLPSEALKPTRNWLPGQLRQAAEFAGGGEWVLLERRLDQIDQQAQIIWLVEYLTKFINKQSIKGPSGVSGMLSQCLFAPNADALGAEHRQQLASVCLYLAGADLMRKQGNNKSLRELMEHAGQLAKELNQTLQSESEEAQLKQIGLRPLEQIDL